MTSWIPSRSRRTACREAEIAVQCVSIGVAGDDIIDVLMSSGLLGADEAALLVEESSLGMPSPSTTRQVSKGAQTLEYSQETGRALACSCGFSP